jgi:hypothetical protein
VSKPHQQSDYVLLSEVARFIGLSYARVLRLAQRGVLPGLVAKFDANAPLLVHMPTLQAWLVMNTIGAEEKAVFVPPKTPPDTLFRAKVNLDRFGGMEPTEHAMEFLRKLRQEMKEQRYRDRMRPPD